MKRRKLVTLVALATLIATGAGFYCVISTNHYDSSKYQLTIVDGLEGGGLKVGSRISFTLPDQFDLPHSLAPETQTLILTFTRNTGEEVRSFLDGRNEDVLLTHHAIFIADFSHLPVVLRNLSVLPRLRKYLYPIVLLYEETMSRELCNPRHRNSIAVATVREGTVESIEYLAGSELEKVFP